jgi:hypothetical protein
MGNHAAEDTHYFLLERAAMFLHFEFKNIGIYRNIASIPTRVAVVLA